MKKAENKLFFFDFDGTLWFGRFGDRTIKALNTLRENGGKIFYNSGRSLGNTRMDRIKEIPFDGLLCGGGYLEIGGKQIFRKDISSEVIKKVIETELKYNLTILYEGVNGVYKRKGILSHCNGEEMDDIFALTDTEKYPITKFSIIKEQTVGNIVPVQKEVWDILSEDFFLVEFDHYVEGMLIGLGKDFLIGETVKYLNANPKETYAFGDSNNDITAFKACNFKIAIAHSPEELKSMANYVTTEEENGVAEALEYLGLI